MTEETARFLKKAMRQLANRTSSILAIWITVFSVLEFRGMEHTLAALLALAIALVLFFVANSTKTEEKASEMPKRKKLH